MAPGQAEIGTVTVAPGQVGSWPWLRARRGSGPWPRAGLVRVHGPGPESGAPAARDTRMRAGAAAAAAAASRRSSETPGGVVLAAVRRQWCFRRLPARTQIESGGYPARRADPCIRSNSCISFLDFITATLSDKSETVVIKSKFKTFIFRS